MADLELVPKSFPVEYGVGQQKLSTVRDIRGKGNYKVINVTYNSGAGTYTFTGVPFRPKAIQIISSTGGSICHGHSDGTTTYSVNFDSAGSAVGTPIIYNTSAGGGSTTARAFLTNFTADGAVITFNLNTTNCYISAMFFG